MHLDPARRACYCLTPNNKYTAHDTIDSLTIITNELGLCY